LGEQVGFDPAVDLAQFPVPETCETDQHKGGKEVFSKPSTNGKFIIDILTGWVVEDNPLFEHVTIH
jgi:hypothetical protein